MKKFIAIAIVSFGVPGAAFAQGCQAPVNAAAAGAQTSCSPAGSPLVSGLSGNVSLSRAGRLVPLENGAQLLAGDRIIAREGGANVAIGATCSASIAANSIATVTRTSGLTCVSQRLLAPASSASSSGFDSRFLAQSIEPSPVPAPGATTVGGGTTTAGGATTAVGGAATTIPATSGLSPLVLAIGGSALAGAAGIAISQSGSSNNRLSP